MDDEKKELLSSIGFDLICIIIAITFIPLVIGIVGASLLELVGLDYFFGVMGFACLIWLILVVWWYV